VREGSVPGQLLIEGRGWSDTITLGAGDEGELRWDWVRREGGRTRRALAVRATELRVDGERLVPTDAAAGMPERDWIFGEWNGKGWRIAGGPMAPSSTAS
jgi:hypothetical protein